jgi:predicted amidohydrolase
VNYKAAVIQAASVPFDPAASAERAVRLIADAAGASARLAVFPEVACAMGDDPDMVLLRGVDLRS